jgi:hypothetical protein
MTPVLGEAGRRFRSTPGTKTKNSPRAGQNLPNTFDSPEFPTGRQGVRSFGPEELGLSTTPRLIGGPGEPPAGWVGGTTSVSEWYLYWAFEKILGPEGADWQYQSSWLGGRQMRGGAVVDYVVRQKSGRRVGVRLQTYRFHFNVDAAEQASDVEQALALSELDFIVIDVFEDQVINDPTGQAAIMAVLEIINERQRPNPLSTGSVIGTG